MTFIGAVRLLIICTSLSLPNSAMSKFRDDCPDFSDRYSWQEYIDLAPIDSGDPLWKKTGYTFFWIYFPLPDVLGETENDPAGRVLSGMVYSITSNKGRGGGKDYLFISGADDYKKCWGPIKGDLGPKGSGIIPIFGQKFTFDDRGRVFDDDMVLVGQLSCVRPDSRELWGKHLKSLGRNLKECKNNLKPPFFNSNTPLDP